MAAAWDSAAVRLAAAILVLTIGGAHGVDARPIDQAPPVAHTRPMDAEARRIIDETAAASSTFVRLADALDSSDVFVLITTSFVREGIEGDTRILGATAGARLLGIRINKLQSKREQMAWLAHELQHALEIAAAPDVRSEVDLAALMRRIGRPGGTPGTFETDAAVRVGRLVQRELASAEKPRRF